MNIDERVFEKLGAFPKWTEADGPAPYVFADRPAGQRCAWSCHWVVQNPNHKNAQIVTPEDWGLVDPGKMTPAQVEAELQDLIYDTLLAAQPFRGTGQERAIASSLELKVKIPNGITSIIFTMLANFRQSYNGDRTYASPYNPPQAGVRKHTQRPGWFKE